MGFRSMLGRGRGLVERHQINMIIGGAFFIGIILGLGLGNLINQSQPVPIIIDRNIKTTTAGDITRMLNNDSLSAEKFPGKFVASLKGKNYYPAGCPAATNIKKENEIWFNSPKEAEDRGYVLSKSCTQ